MGVVVAATHMQLHQQVALKFMLDAIRSNESVERFLREARAAVRLKSEHVARVIDVGTMETGTPFMVMELLEGMDLGGLLDQRKWLGVEEAVEFLCQVCDAIAEAHSKGIIHRDLKPANLFLTKGANGRSLVKVLDFGISKAAGPEDVSLTRTSAIMGSPLYMAPEQMRASRLATERSDIWSLGVILYELIAGRPPFVGDSVTSLALSVVNDEPPPLATIRQGVPIGVEDAILKCLQKEPSKRFQSAGELASALDSYRDPVGQIRERRAGSISSPNQGFGSTPPPALVGGATTGAGRRSSRESLGETVPLPGSVRTTPMPSAPLHPDQSGRVESSPDKVGARTGAAWGGSTGGRPSGMKKWPIFAGVAALIAIGGGVIVLRGMKGKTIANDDPTTASNTVPVTSAPSFHVEVEVQPPTAGIELDGEPVGQGRFTRDLARDGRTHTIRVFAEGFADSRVQFHDAPPEGKIALVAAAAATPPPLVPVSGADTHPPAVANDPKRPAPTTTRPKPGATHATAAAAATSTAAPTAPPTAPPPAAPASTASELRPANGAVIIH
jgi:serine/threonine protein kinase